MDTTPPYQSEPRSRTKSISRLAIESDQIPKLSLDLASPSPKKLNIKSPDSLPLRELLLLSPLPLRQSKARLVDRLDVAEELLVEARKRGKNRGPQLASPRYVRRSKRRSEVEAREERDLGIADEVPKVRKRRNTVKTRKEKLNLVAVDSTSSLHPQKNGECDSYGGNFEKFGQVMSDLIMWRDVAKSSLWFGIGCMCFLSSCFAGGINFSVFSAMSQLGLLFLGGSFLSNSISQRNSADNGREFKLREDDILRLARLMLPATNLVLSKMKKLFSGEPATTLKVAPILLLGAEYGHLITLRRLFAAGFFISFTAPKLYSRHSTQMKQKANYLGGRLLEAWFACSHKKIVAASAVTAFWNLTSLKTRIFAGFFLLVVLRCHRQSLQSKAEEGIDVGVEEQEQEQVQQPQQALVVAKVGSQKVE